MSPIWLILPCGYRIHGFIFVSMQNNKYGLLEVEYVPGVGGVKGLVDLGLGIGFGR